MPKNNFLGLLFVALSAIACAGQNSTSKVDSPKAAKAWNFAVAGDSRNCGDIIMPAIAASAAQNHAEFYWHLGDLRKISGIDEDFKQKATLDGWSPSMEQYHEKAWDDFAESQVKPFEPMPFFLGIGNHETIAPKSRGEFVTKFNPLLNASEIRQQRLKDDPKDDNVHTYYHWIRDGVDFINLDNASHDELDAAQVKWLETILGHDASDSSVRTVVVGMHAALPESISAGHSMNEWSTGEESGRLVYQDLLKIQNDAHKKVYVLASHSHFFMDGIFNTDYWRNHGGVLPGWIIGTAGAERYPLPGHSEDAKVAKTNVYGYLLATVNPAGEPEGRIQFEFKQFEKGDVPARVVERYHKSFVDSCFDGNRGGVLSREIERLKGY